MSSNRPHGVRRRKQTRKQTKCPALSPIKRPLFSDVNSERLILAAKTGAVEQLLEILEVHGGADPNFHGKCDTTITGSTALIEAARGHHWHAMSVLLEHGADPNLAAIRPPESVMQAPKSLCTPLHACVEKARGAAMVACVTLLLYYGADPAAKTMVKVTWMDTGGFYKGGKELDAPAYLHRGGDPGPLQSDGENPEKNTTMKLLKQWKDPNDRQRLLCEVQQTQASAAWWQITRCGALCAMGRASAVGRMGRLLSAISMLPYALQEFVLGEAWGLDMVAWPEAVPRRPPGEPAYHGLLRPPSALLTRPTPRSVVDKSLREILGHTQCREQVLMKGKQQLPVLPALMA